VTRDPEHVPGRRFVPPHRAPFHRGELVVAATGHHPAMLALPVAFTASCAFLLPLDAVALITYAKGYYRMRDMLAPGSLISIVWIVWITLLMLVLGPYLGMD